MSDTKVKLDEGAARVLLGDPDTQGLVIMTILLWAFGDEVILGPDAVDTAELWAMTYDRFGVWLPEECENKVNGMILALESDNFYRDVEVFTAVCMSLASGDIGDLADGEMEELEAFEATWGCIEVMMARSDEEAIPFSDPVARVFRAVTGTVSSQIVMREVTAELEDMRQRFLLLGLEDHHTSLLNL